MQTVIENLINGNLSDAKEGASRYDMWTLAQVARTYLGSRNKAIMAAAYLKGRATFQAYCDCK